MLRFAQTNIVKYLTHTKHGYEFIPTDPEKEKNCHFKYYNKIQNYSNAMVTQQNFEPNL